MPKVYWSDEARATFDRLPSDVQQAIEERLEHLRRFPEMYERIRSGRFRGFRRFFVQRRYVLIYRVFGDTQDGFVREIRPARSRPE